MVNFAGIAAGFLTGPMMDLFGRYRIVITLFIAGAASTILVGGVLSPQLRIIVPAALCLGLCVSGIQKGVSALAVRFYPTQLRSSGLGWTLGCGQIGAILGPFVAGQLIARGWAPASLFFLMSVPMIVGAIGIGFMRSRYDLPDVGATVSRARAAL